jgi:hypothetical protein
LAGSIAGQESVDLSESRRAGGSDRAVGGVHCGTGVGGSVRVEAPSGVVVPDGGSGCGVPILSAGV